MAELAQASSSESSHPDSSQPAQDVSPHIEEVLNQTEQGESGTHAPEVQKQTASYGDVREIPTMQSDQQQPVHSTANMSRVILFSSTYVPYNFFKVLEKSGSYFFPGGFYIIQLLLWFSFATINDKVLLKVRFA